jgi:DNA-directed RNA polymerase subunit H (RpoH/RPB5)
VTTWLGVSLADKDAPSHEIIPEHNLLTKEATEKMLAEFRVSRLQIPKIRIKDAALIGKGAKAGQVVEIARLDGSKYYRLVVE